MKKMAMTSDVLEQIIPFPSRYM